MIAAGRAAARALLDQAGDDLGSPDVVPLEAARESDPPHTDGALTPVR
jgi:hypothetical protein